MSVINKYHFSVVFSLQNEVLGWDFSSEEPGKNTEDSLGRMGSYFSRDRETFQTCKISTKGILFSLLMKSPEGFPPVEAA